MNVRIWEGEVRVADDLDTLPTELGKALTHDPLP